MKDKVPGSLKRWFILHFILDILFAIPLLLFPAAFLQMMGFEMVGTMTARLVGAALISIGGNSFLMRNKGKETYISMLNLKLLWSSFAVIGILITMIEGGPIIGWILLGIFIVFFIIWVYFKRVLS